MGETNNLKSTIIDLTNEIEKMRLYVRNLQVNLQKERKLNLQMETYNQNIKDIGNTAIGLEADTAKT